MQITIESATVTFDKQLGHDVYSILYTAPSGLASGATNQYQAIWGEVEPSQFVRWDVYSNGAYVGPNYLTYEERTNANAALMQVRNHSLATRQPKGLRRHQRS